MGAGGGEPIDTVPGTPTETREWYDRASSLYALVMEDLEFPPTAIAIDNLDITPGDQVLDLGCGAGRAVRTIAERLGPEGRVLGVDFAAGMCRETRDAIENADVRGNAAVVCGDVTELPLGTDGVDVATCSFVLDLLSPTDIDAALAELARVLRPGGQVAIVSLADTEAAGTTLYRSLRDLFPTQLDCRPIPASRLLDSGGYDVTETTQYSLYGLPVSLVFARYPGPGTNGG